MFVICLAKCQFLRDWDFFLEKQNEARVCEHQKLTRFLSQSCKKTTASPKSKYVFTGYDMIFWLIFFLYLCMWLVVVVVVVVVFCGFSSIRIYVLIFRTRSTWIKVCFWFGTTQNQCSSCNVFWRRRIAQKHWRFVLFFVLFVLWFDWVCFLFLNGKGKHRFNTKKKKRPGTKPKVEWK